MGKTRDLFKKIRDMKGIFHVKMGSIKVYTSTSILPSLGRQVTIFYLIEFEQNCTKKDLHNPDNHDDVITNLEPGILECEVKWALESITANKASGGDGIPGELFQILKDDAVKVLHSICQQI